MPLLYLAKINLNSNIFEVYDNSLQLEDVLKNIYMNFNAGDRFELKTKERYIDELGNIEYYNKTSGYSFQEINKLEGNVVTGKLVRTFDKPSEELDPITNKMVKTTVQETVSIYFYYDVYKEMVTFCERQSFGYNQFMKSFVSLLNMIARPYEFEIFLQKDKDKLEEKLSTLVSVQKIRATLIPPNSNEDDLREFREELEYMKQCQEANANKLDIEYESNDLKMDSKVMRDIKTAVSRGYGDLNATGMNHNGRKQTIRSSQDAAYTTNIKENIKPIEFNEEAKNMIDRFISKLSRIRLH